MKLRNSIIVFLVFSLFCAGGVVAAETAPVAADQKVIAKVGDRAITQQELNREMEVIRKRFEEKGRQISDAQLSEIHDEVLDRMVRRELLYNACKKDGVTVEQSEVDANYQMIRARYPNDDDFKKMLAGLHLSEELIKKDIGREMAIKKYIDKKFVKNTTVSDEESKAYYEKTKENFRQPESLHASHILIKVDEGASEEAKAAAKKKIEEIRKQIEDGADFAEMAKKNSEGPSSTKGGDLGFFRRGQMVKPFEDAAFALKPGEVSDIVLTRFGYHIIKLQEKNEESVVAFDMIKDRISQYLIQEKVQKKVNDLIETLKTENPITIM